MTASSEDTSKLHEIEIDVDKQWPVRDKAGAKDGHGRFDLAPHVCARECHWE